MTKETTDMSNREQDIPVTLLKGIHSFPIAAEELEKVKATTASLVQSLNEIETEKAALRTEIAELKRDKERMHKLVSLIWETRWVCEEQDYMDMVGIAAEIRSGNFDGIDAAMTKEGAK